jgi:putative tricarboxylic transport membrane protein
MDASSRTEANERLPGELAFALALLLFSLTALWQAFRIAGFSDLASAGAMPMGTAFVMCICSAIVVWNTRRKPPPRPVSGPIWQQFYHRIMPSQHILFTALIILYMVALEPLGFIVSSFLYLVLSNYALGRRGLVHTVVVNVVLLAIVYLIFQVAFSVVLPEGIVERLWR